MIDQQQPIHRTRQDDHLGDRVARLETTVVSIEKSLADFVSLQRANHQEIFKTLDDLA